MAIIKKNNVTVLNGGDNQYRLSLDYISTNQSAG